MENVTLRKRVKKQTEMGYSQHALIGTMRSQSRQLISGEGSLHFARSKPIFSQQACPHWHEVGPMRAKILAHIGCPH